MTHVTGKDGPVCISCREIRADSKATAALLQVALNDNERLRKELKTALLNQRTETEYCPCVPVAE